MAKWKENRRRPPRLNEELLGAEVPLGDLAPGRAGGLAAAICYPHSYRVGMASLGFQLVWGMFARHGAYRPERYFATPADRPPRGPVPDARSLERGSRLADARVIAFSVYYEPDYFRVYGMLAGADVRPWAAERGEYDPFVILGGPAVTANAEPLAPFADAVFLGDAEESLPRALDALADAGAPRRDVLRKLAGIPGVYVPALYRVTYGPEGLREKMTPTDGAPAEVKPTHVPDLTQYRGGSWLATAHAEFGKLLLLEPIRGCGRGCVFCETPVISAPPRGRALASLWPVVDEAATRAAKVGLVGAAVADYEEIIKLAEGILNRKLRLTVSSLALAAKATPELLRLIGVSGARSVALAPEAATPELRARLKKPLAAGRLEECLEAATAGGLNHVKLYYLVGAPGETPADVAAIGRELAGLRARYKKITFEARVNALVPKPGTACADAELIPAQTYREKLNAVRANAGGVNVVGGSWREAEMQTRLGRGNRETARWIAWITEKAAGSN